MTSEKKENALVEGLKEAGRLVLLYGVSFLLTDGVLANFFIIMFGAKITTQESFLIITAFTIILKSLDKWLHKQGKKTGNDLLLKGLTQF